MIIIIHSSIHRACGNCPTNTTDCNSPQCVIADGIEKSIKTFNRMVPGPSIEVSHTFALRTLQLQEVKTLKGYVYAIFLIAHIVAYLVPL